MSASRFANKVVLVTGGSGTVGSGIIRQFLLENAKVIAPVRSEKGAVSLKETVSTEDVSNLDVFTVDVTDEAEAASFARQLKDKYGSIDHIVSSIGSWWQKGELTEQPAAEFRSQIETYAVSHFLVFKNFVPLLADDASSSYTFITGTAGEMYIPGASMVIVGQGALYGVSIVARGQFANKAPRVNEFRIGATITRDADAQPASGSFSHFQIGKKVADLAASSTKGEVVKCLPSDLK